MSTAPATREPIVAPEKERHELERIERVLPAKPGKARLVGPNGEQSIIPESLYRVLLEAVKQLARGNGISVLPVTAELTTQQAADLLNVSRPFFVEKVLEAGEIPFRTVGTHRRVALKDLLAYKRHRDAGRHEAIKRLGHEARRMGIYDE
jgi:excisionase family DNA binding protein